MKKNPRGDSAKMTRQHFEFIARIIRQSNLSQDDKAKMAELFADELRSTNPNFHMARFITAAVESEKYHKPPYVKNPRKNPRKISMAKLKQEISDLVRGGHSGFSVRLKDGEYALQEWRNGKRYGGPYYTTDAQDVIDTARTMRNRYDRIHR